MNTPQAFPRLSIGLGVSRLAVESPDALKELLVAIEGNATPSACLGLRGERGVQALKSAALVSSLYGRQSPKDLCYFFDVELPAKLNFGQAFFMAVQELLITIPAEPRRQTLHSFLWHRGFDVDHL